ncbi:MAG: adenylate kinase [Candidatus Tyloplasma litorale]|nr:MAG: adenylate kinase [Mycoplasmatales bacterium]
MILIFLGPPGSGKGTISEKMVQNHNFKHISTGDIFRKTISNGTPLGIKVKQIINSGNLVDDKTTWEVAKDALEKFDLNSENIILDGYPRNIDQSFFLEKWLKEQSITNLKEIYFEISKDVIIKRLTSRMVCDKCGRTYNKLTLKPKIEWKCDDDNSELIQRKDDREENVKVRLETYEKVTAPLIKYFTQKNNLIVVKGDDDAESIISKILKSI